MVIGADGVHSFVARAVEAPLYNVQPSATVAAYGYWSGVDLDGGELYVRPNRFFVALPTHDDLVIVAQTIAKTDADAYRDDIERAFAETLTMAPSLSARVAAGTRVERFRLTKDTGGFFRQAHGPGWALVGDAGYHKDPITAQGMLDAFRDADLVSAAIDEGLDGDLDRSLARYQESRDAAVGAMYDFTCQLAHVELPPPPEMQLLIAALAGNQPEMDRFFGVMAGSVSVADFYAPDNVERLLAA